MKNRIKSWIWLTLAVALLPNCRPKPTPGAKNRTDTALVQSLPEKKEDIPETAPHPPISPEELAWMAPVVKKWTNFHRIDPARAQLISCDSVCLTCPPDTLNPYYWEFSQEDDTGHSIGVDYSPDRMRYVDIGFLYEYRNGKPYFLGGDDCQEIYLVDRRLRHQHMILFRGISEMAEAVFWKGNDRFIVAGTIYAAPLKHYLYVFDIAHGTRKYYEMEGGEPDNSGSYLMDVNLKEKGIAVE